MTEQWMFTANHNPVHNHIQWLEGKKSAYLGLDRIILECISVVVRNLVNCADRRYR